jgi:hypothetical protein
MDDADVFMEQYGRAASGTRRGTELRRRTMVADPRHETLTGDKPAHRPTLTEEKAPVEQLVATSSASSSSGFFGSSSSRANTRTRTKQSEMVVGFDVFITLVLIWNSFEIPFRIALLPEIAPLPYQFLIVASLVDWFFVADCAFRFYKPYLHRLGYVVYAPWEIRRHYLTSWFVLDLISSIPWDFMTLCMSMASPALVASQDFWLRYVIVTRLVRLPSIFSRLQEWELTSKVRLLLLFLIFFLSIISFSGTLAWSGFGPLASSWASCCGSTPSRASST